MSTKDKQTNLTAEEAIAIIEREIACVNKECNIERACGQCELVMPSKEPIIEAYKLAIEALKAKPFEDCVSRQAVLDTLAKFEKPCDDRLDFYLDSTIELEEEIKELPPVMPQPKTGHWVDCGEREPWYRCSECGRRVWGGANQYCPDCGLKMVKPYESEKKE